MDLVALPSLAITCLPLFLATVNLKLTEKKYYFYQYFNTIQDLGTVALLKAVV